MTPGESITLDTGWRIRRGKLNPDKWVLYKPNGECIGVSNLDDAFDFAAAAHQIYDEMLAVSPLGDGER